MSTKKTTERDRKEHQRLLAEGKKLADQVRKDAEAMENIRPEHMNMILD